MNVSRKGVGEKKNLWCDVESRSWQQNGPKQGNVNRRHILA